MSTDTSTRRRAAVLAGHTGDTDAARAAWGDPDGRVREAALGALERCDALDGALLGEALLVEGVALGEVLAQHPRGPLTEAGRAAGVDAVADRDHCIEVVVLEPTFDLSFALLTNR